MAGGCIISRVGEGGATPSSALRLICEEFRKQNIPKTTGDRGAALINLIQLVYSLYTNVSLGG